MVSFDRPGYGESDPHPAKTVESAATDIEELADQLKLGSKFHVIGFSMGGELVWGCLRYIPHRYDLFFVVLSFTHDSAFVFVVMRSKHQSIMVQGLSQNLKSFNHGCMLRMKLGSRSNFRVKILLRSLCSERNIMHDSLLFRMLNSKM